jgi:hypothetical protein
MIIVIGLSVRIVVTSLWSANWDGSQHNYYTSFNKLLVHIEFSSYSRYWFEIWRLFVSLILYFTNPSVYINVL